MSGDGRTGESADFVWDTMAQQKLEILFPYSLYDRMGNAQYSLGRCM